ncbi:MAG TPA: hypothetical protein VGM83_16550 [Devosiaceae bacterium]
MRSLPTWELTILLGLVGAIAGGFIAWIIARLLTRKRVPLWPVLIVAVCCAFIPGAIGRSNPAAPSLCDVAQLAASNANGKQVGTKLDDVTTFQKLDVDCTARSIVYQVAAAITPNQIVGGDWSPVQTQLNNNECGDASWRRFIDAGWTIANTYTLTDQSKKTLTVSCAGL